MKDAQSSTTDRARGWTFQRTSWVLKAFLSWVPLAVAVTVLSGLVYVAVQQSYRQNADDPQVQMVEDAAAQLQAGMQPQEVVGTGKVDMLRSLAPFLIVYDESGQVLAASVQLNGQTPQVPDGLFLSVTPGREHRVTWQPQPGVRSAAVLAHYGGSKSGFVLAGRSLREVEDRVDRLTQAVLLACLAALVVTFIASAVATALRESLRRR